jgi:hypothetical protein
MRSVGLSLIKYWIIQEMTLLTLSTFNITLMRNAGGRNLEKHLRLDPSLSIPDLVILKMSVRAMLL